MKFIRLYNVNKSSVLEIFVDEYIKWQPKTEYEIPEKMIQFKKVCDRIQDKCIILIDCDKAIYFDKVNYILIEKMISNIHVNLAVIIKNCNPQIKNLVNSLKIPKNIRVYFNDIY